MKFLRQFMAVCVLVAAVIGVGFAWKHSAAASLVADDRADRPSASQSPPPAAEPALTPAAKPPLPAPAASSTAGKRPPHGSGAAKSSAAGEVDAAAPPASAAAGNPASRGTYSRCSSLMQKTTLGEALTPSERREMAEFCR